MMDQSPSGDGQKKRERTITFQLLPPKERLAIRARFVAGTLLNAFLFYHAFYVAGKMTMSNELRYHIINALRDFISGFLPLLIVLLLLPVVVLGRNKERIFALILSAFPVLFGCIVWYAFLTDFLSTE